MTLNKTLENILKPNFLEKINDGSLTIKEKSYSIPIKNVPKNALRLNLESEHSYSKFLNEKAENIHKKVDLVLFIDKNNDNEVFLVEFKSTKPELGKKINENTYKDGEVSLQFIATTCFLTYINTLLINFFNLKINKISYAIVYFKPNKKGVDKTKPGKASKPDCRHITLIYNKNQKMPVLAVNLKRKPSAKSEYNQFNFDYFRSARASNFPFLKFFENHENN